MSNTQNVQVRIGRKNAPATPATPTATAPATPPNAQVRIGRKNAPATSATPPATAPATPPNAQAVTDEDLKKVITDAITTKMADIKPGVTADEVGTIIAAELAKFKADSKAITKDNIGELVNASIQAFADANKQPAKPVHGKAEHPGSSQIEIPVSWSKGNLPLHGKQLLNILLKKDMNDGIDASELEKGRKLGDAVVNGMKSFKGVYTGFKALTSTGSNAGDELVPTDLSSQIQSRLYLASELYSIFAGQEIDMPTNPYGIPVSTTRPKFFSKTENTDATASTPATAQPVLTASTFSGYVTASYELDEDSLVPVLPWLEKSLAEAAAYTWESVLINGDTTSTHQDSDTAAIDGAAEKAFKGFRKLAYAGGIKSDMSSGNISTANLAALKKLMGKYGVNSRDLVIVVGPKGINDLMALSEVLTADKAGPYATILTGKLPSIFGIPIVTSEANREDLNATCVFDNTTKTKGSILIINKSQFLLGRRREFTVEIEKNVKGQCYNVVASFRKAFAPLETPSATIASVAVGYNYTA